MKDNNTAAASYDTSAQQHDLPKLVRALNLWTKLERITDEDGAPWDTFTDQDGTLTKFESRDCAFKHGRVAAGAHPQVRYARRQDGLQSSFATLRALYAYFQR